MELGLYFAVCDRLPLEDALAWAASLGITSVELSCHVNGRFDVDEMLDKSRGPSLRKAIAAHGLRVSAINMSADGQLVLGPHHADTDWIFPGTPEEKRSFGLRRIRRAADLAAELNAPVVTGFLGCEDYSRWFPWPDQNAWERMEAQFPEVVSDTLDHYASLGLVFAWECHPKQLAYNTETALRVLQLVDNHPALAFNLDPANLALAGVDPVVFVAELKDRVVNVHAKDAELVPHNAARSGLLAHGDWGRPDRGFRFRVAGWGDVPWRRLITELAIHGYHGPLTIEHEDPTMGPKEGVEKAARFLEPLLICERREDQWW